MLNILRHGDPAPDQSNPGQPALLIAHGLFGSARNWGVIAKRLADSREVLAVDMRNHGRSPWSEPHSYDAMAEDLAQVIADHGAPVDLLGHSMGGKAAMTLALAQPALIRRLIVADIAPAAYGHSQRHLIEAMRAVDPARATTRPEADAQLAAHVDDPQVRAFLLQSYDPREGCWRLNLDALDRWMQQTVGWTNPEGRFDGPTLFLSGAESDYVRPEHRPAIKALFPAAQFAKIPGAGHWLHAEKPREFEAAVRVFLG
ncbi:alpha/beta hydrolase [Brevirhabdus pacifica]|uniref:Alpha/beta hydrolase n=1 Tax=Brevirhabdus pacifica TaxID=1267768 RepID=A0A1U7DK69_9RHOB|nr:alpha/beta fold hydrolase [Brevirhabdus pacifica]APX90268.1 alpha/beta hydrolase [Brevirhabdus pacifica]OWU78687.1 esterase [Loktanella sp. 22II-4b]PJJ80714.1 pimeloyl-ACP methyl ester carboxylesterase [Brevirhabdus pacifica]